jgi:hypothetical protein
VSGHFGADLWIWHEQSKLFFAVRFVTLRACIELLRAFEKFKISERKMYFSKGRITAVIHSILEMAISMNLQHWIANSTFFF